MLLFSSVHGDIMSVWLITTVNGCNSGIAQESEYAQHGTGTELGPKFTVKLQYTFKVSFWDRMISIFT